MGSIIVFVAALVVAVVGLYWLILRNASEKIARQYELLAERFGFELDQPEPKMGGLMRPEPSVYGTYRNREISISVPGKGLQNTRQVETVLKVAVSGKALEAQLTASGPLAGMRQRDSGGKARWKSGDAHFDAAVDVRTNTGDALAALLTSERRNWLASQLKRSKGTLYLGREAWAFTQLGLISSEATRQNFEAAVEFLCDWAESTEVE